MSRLGSRGRRAGTNHLPQSAFRQALPGQGAPIGAWYCLISATGSYISNHSLRDAAFACIGGFLAGVTTPPRGKYGPTDAVSAPTWYDSAMQAEVAAATGDSAAWSTMVPNDSAEYVPSWVTASETP